MGATITEAGAVGSAGGLVAGRSVDRIVPQDDRRRGCCSRIFHEPRPKGFRSRPGDSLGRLFSERHGGFLRGGSARARVPGCDIGSRFACRHLCGPAPLPGAAMLSQTRSFAPLRALQRKVILYPPRHDATRALVPNRPRRAGITIQVSCQNRVTSRRLWPRGPGPPFGGRRQSSVTKSWRGGPPAT